MNATVAPVEVRPVSGLRDFLAFCRLPREIYAGQTGFVPALDAERWTLFAHKLNPHYAQVDSQAFLAFRGGRTVGRIEAQRYRTIEPLDVSRAQFGAIDAIDDAAVVAALTGAAESWLAARGAELIHGPYSPSVNSECGLLVQGFDATPMIFMPWHPEWLGRHLEAAGYAKASDLVSYRYPVTERDRIAEPVLLSRPEWQRRIKFRSLRFHELKAEAALLVEIFNDGWSANWGFVPLGLDEFLSMADSLKHLMTEDFGFVVEVDGDPVSFGIVIPNLHEITADLNGRLFPTGLPRLLSRIRKRSYKTARLALFGIRRKYHRSIMGGVIVGAMIEEMRLRSRNHAFDALEFGWVLEDNVGMRRPIEMTGAKVDKVHRIYEKRLAASARAAEPRTGAPAQGEAA
jgi:hypothetical protein